MPRKDRAAMLEAMAGWTDYHGLRPFASATAGFATDRAAEHFGNAVCLLSMLAAATRDEQQLTDDGKDSEFGNRSGAVRAGALEGISTLIDLGALLLDSGG